MVQVVIILFKILKGIVRILILGSLTVVYTSSQENTNARNTWAQPITG